MRIKSVRFKNWKSFQDSGRIDLGQANVIVGRNNSGKSAILRAIHLIQEGAESQRSDIRLGETQGSISFVLEDAVSTVVRSDDPTKHVDSGDLDLLVRFSVGSNPTLNLSSSVTLPNNKSGYGVELLRSYEPSSFIYPYFSKRKVSIDTSIDAQRTVAVTPDFRNLASKVLRLSDLSYEGHEEYVDLCEKLFGFAVSTYAVEHGHKIGISVGRQDHIPLEAMGEGVTSMLGLITSLCLADGRLFLIEEPENDIHPEALKALLQVIVEKSTNNQFVVTTHSNIVAKYLGGAPGARLFSVESDIRRDRVPNSTIASVGDTVEERVAVLRHLGYELFDFDLHDGWLMLEESSAQAIIQNYLIPWFAPRLSRVQVVSAGGVSNVEPTFNDFRRLFLFAHLEEQYRGRAWVVVDGDEPGSRAVASLRETYTTWSADHFRTWQQENFEYYYPEQFAEQVSAALALSGQKKREAKKSLVLEVRAWCDADPVAARSAFSDSAQEVINFLREIDCELFG